MICSDPLLPGDGGGVNGDDDIEHISSLPDALLLQIFKKMDISTLLTCAQVSHRWHRLSLDGSNWAEVDLFNYQKDVQTNTVRKLSKRCGGFLRVLNLRCCQNVTDSTIEMFGANCHNITTIDLSQCHRITDGALKSLGENCASLRKARFYSCPFVDDRGLLELSRGCHKLDEINLAWCSKVTDQGVDYLTAHCPALTNLDLTSTSITDNGMGFIAQRLTAISRLSLRHCGSITDQGVRLITAQFNQNLTHLHLSRCHQLTDLTLESIARYCTQLLTLDMARCNNLTDSGFYTFAASCCKIQRMDLEECLNITDNSLLQLSIHCPCLKELTLSHCENLTDAGIEYLVRSEVASSLVSIELDNCPSLTDHTIQLLSRCEHIKRIGLVDCSQISKDSVDRVTRRHPELKVQAYFAPDSPPTVAVPIRSFFRCPIRYESCTLL